MEQVLKLVSAEEITARAYYLYLKRLEQGKTSKRITVVLKPTELPPKKGDYGGVRILPYFNATKGKWYVTVILPSFEGFKLAELIKSPNPFQSTQLSPSKQS